MTARKLIGSAITAALAVTTVGLASLAPPALAAEPETQAPYHPTILWADSEELVGESAPNGSIAALVDDDSGKPLAQKTFWTTKWKNGTDAYPHGIVMQSDDDADICGIQYTSRPSYELVEGNSNAPGSYTIYAFDEAPEKPADMAAWRTEVAAGTFGNGEKIAEGGLVQTNDPQTIKFDAQSKRVFAIVGHHAIVQKKKGMSASDIKLVPCVKPATEPVTGEGVDTLVHDFFIDQLPYGEPGENVWFTPSNHTYKATAYYHTNQVSVRIRTVEGATVTINGQAPDNKGRVTVPIADGLNTVLADVTGPNGEKATYGINITKVNTDFRGHERVEVTANINGGSEADNAALVDGNMGTGYTAQPVVISNDWTDSVTGFTLTLPEQRQVQRVSGWGSWISPQELP